MKTEVYNVWAIIVQWLILGATLVYVILVYKTLRAGQRQADEANKLTSQNLAINQFQIYNDEFKNIYSVFLGLKFEINSQLFNSINFDIAVKEANGINYILVFEPLLSSSFSRITRQRVDRIDEFRSKIIFPLYRNYLVLNEFLERVKKDEILTQEYKNILFLRVERDLLQHYLRICNYEFPPGNKSYVLDIFNVLRFDSASFYLINDFFIRNNAFQMNDLQFYKDHN